MKHSEEAGNGLNNNRLQSGDDPEPCFPVPVFNYCGSGLTAVP